MSPRALFEILFTSAIICKQRFFHENEIVQHLKNYKYIDIKLSKSVYIAKSRQRYHKSLDKILLHAPNQVLKNLQMFNHGIIKNANKLYYTRFFIIFFNRIISLKQTHLFFAHFKKYLKKNSPTIYG